MIRFNNIEKKIIRAIFGEGALSRPELCRLTSSSWSGISKYVSGLLEKEFLEKCSQIKSSGPGRPASLLKINPEICLAGISISYGKVQVVICNSRGEVIQNRERGIARDEDPIPEAIKLLNKLMTPDIKRRIISIGVSFPGIISSDKRSVQSSVYFSEFYKRDVVEEFELALKMDIPVLVERNAVCELTAVVYEYRMTEDTLLISLNSGVSAAILADGQILDGKTGNLATLGHFPDGESTIPCLCGRNGCLDTVAGEVAWIRDFRKISKLPEASDSFYNAIEHGMPQAVKMLQHSLSSLFSVLTPLLMIFEPENLIFSADLPPSSGLVFSTLMEQNHLDTVSNIRFSDTLYSPKGAAILGFQNICDSGL